MTQHKSNLVVVLNSQKIIEYHQDRPLTKKQLLDLGSLESKLNKGIQIANQFIAKPSLQDKATFMANLLISALIDDEEAKVALACSYLARYCGDLKQIKALNHADRISIELIYDEEYREQAPIKFVPRNSLE